MLNGLIELAKKSSRAIVESGLSHVPMLLIDVPNRVIVSPIYGNFKPVFRVVVSGLLREVEASAYVFISEAWETIQSEDSAWLPAIYSGEIKIEDLPLDDRQEVLCIHAVENGKQFHFFRAKITQTSAGRVLGDWEERTGVTGMSVLTEW